MESLRINIAARTDKAGRSANQDNLLVCADLERISAPDPAGVNKDNWIPLGALGTLLVVADGMGGASSGEVASAMVVQSLRGSFSAVPPHIPGDDDKMLQFMRQALVKADQEIKVYAEQHPESHGMGSTTVMVWLYCGKAYCAWVGDSRIYRFTSGTLSRLSHDHSYVQQLVDAGAITEEQAFHHPQGNIITRAMGDTGKPVEPDVAAVTLNPGDAIMLCSDGLCGLLPDNVIQTVIARNIADGPTAVLKSLWTAGEAAEWTDNATIIVAMTSLAEPRKAVPPPTQQPSVAQTTPPPPQAAPAPHVENKPMPENKALESGNGKWWNKPVVKIPVWAWGACGCLLCGAGVVAALSLLTGNEKKPAPESQVISQPAPAAPEVKTIKKTRVQKPASHLDPSAPVGNPTAPRQKAPKKVMEETEASGQPQQPTVEEKTKPVTPTGWDRVEKAE